MEPGGACPQIISDLKKHGKVAKNTENKEVSLIAFTHKSIIFKLSLSAYHLHPYQ